MTDTIASLTARNAALEARGTALARQLTAVIQRLDGQAYSSTLSALNDFKAALRPSPDDRAKVDDTVLLELVEEGVKARLRDEVGIAEECARIADSVADIHTGADANRDAFATAFSIASAIRARFGRPA